MMESLAHPPALGLAPAAAAPLVLELVQHDPVTRLELRAPAPREPVALGVALAHGDLLGPGPSRLGGATRGSACLNATPTLVRARPRGRACSEGQLPSCAYVASV